MKHLKHGGARRFEGTFLLSKRGHFQKTRRAFLCLLQNLGGMCPQCSPPPPVPTSMNPVSNKTNRFSVTETTFHTLVYLTSKTSCYLCLF